MLGDHSSKSDPDPSGYFFINPQTGEIRLKASLEDLKNETVILTVHATNTEEPNHKATATVENKAAVDSYFTYSTHSLSDGGEFDVIQLEMIDRELTGNWIDIHLVATDDGTPPKSGRSKLRVNVEDIDDNLPAFPDGPIYWLTLNVQQHHHHYYYYHHYYYHYYYYCYYNHYHYYYDYHYYYYHFYYYWYYQKSLPYTSAVGTALSIIDFYATDEDENDVITYAIASGNFRADQFKLYQGLFIALVVILVIVIVAAVVFLYNSYNFGFSPDYPGATEPYGRRWDEDRVVPQDKANVPPSHPTTVHFIIIIIIIVTIIIIVIVVIVVVVVIIIIKSFAALFIGSFQFVRHVLHEPFQTPVYVTIGGCFVSVLVLLLLLEKCRWSFGGPQRALTGKEAVVQWAVEGLLIVLAGLAKEPTEVSLRSRAGHVLVWAWLMFGVVLASVYSSKLTSSLTVSDQALPFTSLSQLVNQDTYTWGVMPGTAQESILKRYSHPVERRVKVELSLSLMGYTILSVLFVKVSAVQHRSSHFQKKCFHSLIPGEGEKI
nr:hypothetical protein BaRGS_006136 [Batillaria attramentaria]